MYVKNKNVQYICKNSMILTNRVMRILSIVNSPVMAVNHPANMAKIG